MYWKATGKQKFLTRDQWVEEYITETKEDEMKWINLAGFIAKFGFCFLALTLIALILIRIFGVYS